MFNLLTLIICSVIIYLKIGGNHGQEKEYCNIFGYSIFQIETGSMSKTLEVEDIRIIKLGNDKINKNDSYWFGLVPDDSEAYDYNNFQDFSSAPVFDGKSLRQIWSEVEVLSIDSCNPMERLSTYIL